MELLDHYILFLDALRFRWAGDGPLKASVSWADKWWWEKGDEPRILHKNYRMRGFVIISDDIMGLKNLFHWSFLLVHCPSTWADWTPDQVNIY